MSRRKLTDAELRAYREMAAAARRLQEAQRAAEEARRQERVVLSMTEAQKKGGRR
jgi:hypothetical protein